MLQNCTQGNTNWSSSFAGKGIRCSNPLFILEKSYAGVASSILCHIARKLVRAIRRYYLSQTQANPQHCKINVYRSKEKCRFTVVEGLDTKKHRVSRCTIKEYYHFTGFDALSSKQRVLIGFYSDFGRFVAVVAAFNRGMK